MSQYDPDDLRTHQRAWRKAIEIARDSCRLPGEHDDRAYWEHELKVFDRTMEGIVGNDESGPISAIEASREAPAPRAWSCQALRQPR